MNQQIIDQTFQHLEVAYAPYSNFQVAACIVCKDKQYYGVNIENASYSMTMCAERSALFHAYSHGVRKADIVALIVVTKQEELVYPCGACRQVMIELMELDCEVFICNLQHQDRLLVKDLLPKAFKKENVL